MKNLFMTMLAVFGLVSVTAQEASVFSIGPRIGYNNASVSGLENDASISNPVFGITSTYSINESSGLSVDLLYSKEGYVDATDEDVDINYIRIPFYYNLFFRDYGDTFRPKLYVGVSPGFMVDAERDDVEIDNGINSFNFGILGGAGFNYQLSPAVWLNTDLRADLGLTDIRDGNTTGDKVASRVISFSVGLAVGI